VGITDSGKLDAHNVSWLKKDLPCGDRIRGAGKLHDASLDHLSDRLPIERPTYDGARMLDGDDTPAIRTWHGKRRGV
jgi:hypothetical protein